MNPYFLNAPLLIQHRQPTHNANYYSEKCLQQRSTIADPLLCLLRRLGSANMGIVHLGILSATTSHPATNTFGLPWLQIVTT